MDTEQENTVSEESMYDAAIAPDPTPEAEVREERARDEKGRFAKEEQVVYQGDTYSGEKEAPVAEAQPVQPQAEKVDHRIPLTELLSEREKRQSEQRQREALQRELDQLRQQMQPQKQPEPVPDQFANPEAYNQYWEQRIAEQQQSVDQRFRAQEANFSLRLAHMQHGEVFEEAYQALLDRAEKGDRAAAQQVANSPDPGRTLIDWYKREQVIAQVGTNPEEYVQKKLEEALSDPEFLAKALERARGVAATQPTQVKLPPSLNKATSASRSDDTADLSDRGLYHHAIGR
jgi:hypothetical protein